jgi:hypothetical protein
VKSKLDERNVSLEQEFYQQRNDPNAQSKTPSKQQSQRRSSPEKFTSEERMVLTDWIMQFNESMMHNQYPFDKLLAEYDSA